MSQVSHTRSTMKSSDSLAIIIVIVTLLVVVGIFCGILFARWWYRRMYKERRVLADQEEGMSMSMPAEASKRSRTNASTGKRSTAKRSTKASTNKSPTNKVLTKGGKRKQRKAVEDAPLEAPSQAASQAASEAASQAGSQGSRQSRSEVVLEL